jgi:hypothetical protein
MRFLSSAHPISLGAARSPRRRQQLPFLACPGGQKLPPLEYAPAFGGSTTTEPAGVYIAQPESSATIIKMDQNLPMMYLQNLDGKSMARWINYQPDAIQSIGRVARRNRLSVMRSSDTEGDEINVIRFGGIGADFVPLWRSRDSAAGAGMARRGARGIAHVGRGTGIVPSTDPGGGRRISGPNSAIRVAFSLVTLIRAIPGANPSGALSRVQIRSRRICLLAVQKKVTRRRAETRIKNKTQR